MSSLERQVLLEEADGCVASGAPCGRLAALRLTAALADLDWNVSLTHLGRIMKQIDLKEAKAKLEELIERAVADEPFVIVKNGVPIATVAALRPPADIAPPKRRIGLMEGQFTVPDDFNTMYREEIAKLFGAAD